MSENPCSRSSRRSFKLGSKKPGAQSQDGTPGCFFCCWEAKLSRGWIFQYLKIWHITHPVIPNLMNSRLMLDFRFQSPCWMDFSPDLQRVAKWQPQHLSFRKARGFFQTSNGIIWPSTTCFSWPGEFFFGTHGCPHIILSRRPHATARYVNPEGEVKGLTSDGNKIRDRIQVRQSGQIKRGNENQGYSLLFVIELYSDHVYYSFGMIWMDIDGRNH